MYVFHVDVSSGDGGTYDRIHIPPCKNLSSCGFKNRYAHVDNWKHKIKGKVVPVL
jgi:hypothetical protein